MVVAIPGLVDVQLTGRAAELERGAAADVVGQRAVVPEVAVEEFAQLVARGAAGGAVGQRRVGQVEVDVAPRVLMRGSREHVRRVVVEVLDRPAEVAERRVGAARAVVSAGRGRGGECDGPGGGEGQEGQEEGGGGEVHGRLAAPSEDRPVMLRFMTILGSRNGRGGELYSRRLAGIAKVWAEQIKKLRVGIAKQSSGCSRTGLNILPRADDRNQGIPTLRQGPVSPPLPVRERRTAIPT